MFECEMLSAAPRNMQAEPDAEGGGGHGEEVVRWNLRKCSAAALDVVSTVFNEDLLPTITAIVEQKLRVRPLVHEVGSAANSHGAGATVLACVHGGGHGAYTCVPLV